MLFCARNAGDGKGGGGEAEEEKQDEEGGPAGGELPATSVAGGAEQDDGARGELSLWLVRWGSAGSVACPTGFLWLRGLSDGVSPAPWPMCHD